MAYVIGGNFYRGRNAFLVAGFVYLHQALSKNVSHVMEKQKILAGVGQFFKKLFLGLGLIIVVVVAVNWLFFGEDAAPAQQATQAQIDVAVSSQSVKEVGGKYRYFFNIKNNDTKPFSGDVNIVVVNAEGDSVYEETFSTSQPLVPSGGTSVYIDANTGPTSVHGSYGVQTYTYTAKVGDGVVKEGSGTISALVE